jgi:pyruvate dehydrogenase E2 component (dihydrolipoamide acetyltransferase)
VTREDLRAALGQAPEKSVDAGRVSAVSGEAREERVPILGMRRQIAERMHRSKSQAAHFTFVEECDASRLVELRARLEPEAERRGVQLSYLPFIVKAVVQALAAHPVLNSAVDDEARELVYKKYYNIGIATATDAGLMVPVIRGADRMRLFELAREISRLAEAARQGSLRPEELRGGSFTITSLGKRSGLLATPILNYPEVGILGVHRIKDKPVVRDGQIVVGQIMLLSLSFDHRIVDGHVGAEFAYEVIDYLENPEKLFYESL